MTHHLFVRLQLLWKTCTVSWRFTLIVCVHSFVYSCAAKCRRVRRNVLVLLVWLWQQHLRVGQWRGAGGGWLSPPACSESWRPACGGEPRSPRGTPACPGGSGRLRSWLWTGCTCDTALASARPRTVSRATGEKGWTRACGSQSGRCGGTSCTGGRLPRPSLWLQDQIHLQDWGRFALHQFSVDSTLKWWTGKLLTNT